jgi:hypothetical protein
MNEEEKQPETTETPETPAPPISQETLAAAAAQEPREKPGFKKGHYWNKRIKKWCKRETKPLPIAPEKIDSTPRGKPSAKWRPARITDIPMEFKNPSRTYHFFRDTPNSLRKRIMEQWNIDMEIARKMDEAFGQRTLQSGTSVDGAYRVNELILMWMPKEMAEDRNKYFAERAKVDSTAIRESLRGNIGNDGGDRRAGIYTQHPSGVLPDMNKTEKWDGKI